MKETCRFLIVVAISHLVQTNISAQVVVSGGVHSIALCNDNTVQTWGSNPDGELGIGTNSYGSGTPVQVSNLAGITSVSAGNYHCLALKNNGIVLAWGRNSDGQLGNGNNVDTNLPTQVNLLSNVKSIAAGLVHSLALTNDSTVWSWGQNTWGQLGNGSSISTNSPVQVAGLTGIIAIAAGGNNSLALKKDGTVWIWGANGQAGNHFPVKKNMMTGITSIACGFSHFLALKNDSTVYTWGVYAGNSSSLRGITAIAAGYSHCLALKRDSTVWAWGSNDRGQLGNGSCTDSFDPIAVENLTGIIAISSGGSANSFAIKNDNTVWAWGDNAHGELGVGYSMWNGAGYFSTIPLEVTGICQVFTKIKEIKNEVSVSIFPNPSSGIFTINLDSKTSSTRINVHDLIGNCLWSKNYQNDTGEIIDLTNYPKGMYFLEILSGTEKIVRKIVVE